MMAIGTKMGIGTGMAIITTTATIITIADIGIKTTVVFAFGSTLVK